MAKDLFEAASRSLSDTSAPQPQQGPGQPARRAPFPLPPGGAPNGAERPSAPPGKPPAPTANVPPSHAAKRPPAPPATEPSPAPSVKDQFRVRFRRQLVLIALMLTAFWGAKLDSHEIHSPLEIVALAVLFIALILTFINWRCPSCNRYLYRRIYPRSCPRCGVVFHD